MLAITINTATHTPLTRGTRPALTTGEAPVMATPVIVAAAVGAFAAGWAVGNG